MGQTLPKSNDTTIDTLVSEEEVDYMIVELEHVNEELKEQQRELEQILTYYSTILTASVAAIAAAAIGTSNADFTVVFAVISLLVAGAGHLAFLGIVTKMAAMVRHGSNFYLIREYFFGVFPSVRGFLEKKSEAEIREHWRHAFRDTNMILLLTFVSFNCGWLAAFVYVALQYGLRFAQVNGFFLQFDVVGTAVIFAITTFCFTGLAEAIGVSRYANRLRDYTYKMFGDRKVSIGVG